MTQNISKDPNVPNWFEELLEAAIGMHKIVENIRAERAVPAGVTLSLTSEEADLVFDALTEYVWSDGERTEQAKDIIAKLAEKHDF